MARYELHAIGDGEPFAITCHGCGHTSHNPNDIAARYCGYCHQFLGPLGADEAAPPAGELTLGHIIDAARLLSTGGLRVVGSAYLGTVGLLFADAVILPQAVVDEMDRTGATDVAAAIERAGAAGLLTGLIDARPERLGLGRGTR